MIILSKVLSAATLYWPISTRQVAAYIRILSDAFPADPGFSSEDNRKEDTLWKEKALSLEKQLSSLQQNFDEEHAGRVLAAHFQTPPNNSIPP